MNCRTHRFAASQTILAGALALCLAISSASFAASDRLAQQKIGFVDLMEIQMKAAPVKAQIEQAEKTLAPKMEQADQIQKQLAQLAQEAKNPTLLSDKRKAEIKQQVDDLNDKMNVLKQQIQRQMDEQMDNTTSAATDMILRAIKAVADSQGYSLVLSKESIIYGIPSVDLTAPVIQYLNGSAGAKNK